MLQRAAMKRDNLCRIIISKQTERVISVLAGVWRSIVSSLSTSALQHLRLFFSHLHNEKPFFPPFFFAAFACMYSVHYTYSVCMLQFHQASSLCTCLPGTCCFFMFCVIEESSWLQQKILHWLLSLADQIFIDRSHTSDGRGTFTV